MFRIFHATYFAGAIQGCSTLIQSIYSKKHLYWMSFSSEITGFASTLKILSQTFFWQFPKALDNICLWNSSWWLLQPSQVIIVFAFYFYVSAFLVKFLKNYVFCNMVLRMIWCNILSWSLSYKIFLDNKNS